MANEDTNTVTAEDISKATAMLKGEDTEPTEKAAPPFEKKDESEKTEEKEAEKSIPASEVATIVEQAVSKAVELVKAELFTHQGEVNKALGAITTEVGHLRTDTRAVLQFQGASVDVLKDFQAVTKSIEVKVDEIGNQPAPRKGATTETVEKGVAPAAPAISMDPLWQWMREQDFDLGTKFDTSARVANGNYADIPQTVLKSMGVLQ